MNYGRSRSYTFDILDHQSQQPLPGIFHPATDEERVLSGQLVQRLLDENPDQEVQQPVMMGAIVDNVDGRRALERTHNLITVPSSYFKQMVPNDLNPELPIASIYDWQVPVAVQRNVTRAQQEEIFGGNIGKIRDILSYLNYKRRASKGPNNE